MFNNIDVFAELVNHTITVSLTGGKLLEVRRVPFVTTMRVLSELAALLHTELVTSSARVLDLISKVMTDETLSDMQRGTALVEGAAPFLITLTQNSPDILEGILKDVLPDAPPELFAAITFEDSLLILAGVFEAMDKAVIAKQVKSVFFGVRGVMETVNPPQPETPQESEPEVSTEKPA